MSDTDSLSLEIKENSDVEDEDTDLDDWGSWTIDSDLNKLDIKLFTPTTKQLKMKDKAVFTAGVINVVLLVYFSGKYPWIMPYFYTVKFPLLMVLRTYSFCSQNYQYYMLDWCYFANLLVLIYLWTPLRSSPHAFTVVFCLSHGALPFAVFLFRNSLVFHSLDRITSCFIHISPMLVMWCLRWNGALFEADHQWAVCDPYTGLRIPTKWDVIPKNTSSPTTSSDSFVLPGCSSIFWTLFIPVVCYIGWFILYGILMLILKPDLTKYGTTYTAMTKRGLGRKVKRMPCGCLIYAIINTIMSTLMVAPAVIFLYYEWVNFAFICLILIIASWNGGSFYVEVFSRKYLAQLAKSSGD